MCKEKIDVPGNEYYNTLTDEQLEERIKRAQSITSCAVAYRVASEYLGQLLYIREQRKAA